MTATPSNADSPAETHCELTTLRSAVLPLVASSLAAASVTLLVPHLLTGPPAMNGSAKGTALVILLGGVPVLGIAYRRALDGSLVAMTVAAGAAAYLVYNAVLLAFATPFNRAFPLYEAMLGFGIWALVGLVTGIWDRPGHPSQPASRWPAVFILGVVGLNLLAWASNLVPALVSDNPGEMLSGTGLTTNPVYVQDLAFWLPAFVWVAVGAWRGHGPRTALAVATLTYWVLESASVAIDQWWGHLADPTSTVVSADVVPMFVVVGALTFVPLVAAVRSVRRAGPSSRGTSDGPGSSRPMTVVDRNR